MKFGGELWEVPRGLARLTIELHRRLLEGPDALYVVHEGRRVRLHRLDPHLNATSGRATIADDSEAPAPAPRTASMRRFDHDHPSMLAADGGYVDPDSKEEP